MNLIWIIFIGISLLSYIVQANLNRKFKKYSEEPLGNGMTGRDVAERMLRTYGINDVQVTCVEGHLTDHYDPTKRTVNLSPEVYSSSSVAAAAVAAHECGHAVQHATAYAPLKMRSALVPVVSFASKWVSWIILAGILFIESFPGLLLAWMRFFAKKEQNQRFKAFTKAMWGTEDILAAADIFEEYIKSVGVETRISQFGCTEESLEELTDGVVSVSFLANGTLASVPPITRDDAYEIYKLAL